MYNLIYSPYIPMSSADYIFQIFYLGDTWYIDVTQILIEGYKRNLQTLQLHHPQNSLPPIPISLPLYWTPF